MQNLATISATFDNEDANSPEKLRRKTIVIASCLSSLKDISPAFNLNSRRSEKKHFTFDGRLIRAEHNIEMGRMQEIGGPTTLNMISSIGEFKEEDSKNSNDESV